MSRESIHVLIVVIVELLARGVLVFIGLPAGGPADKFVVFCGKYLRKRLSKAHQRKKKKGTADEGEGKVNGMRNDTGASEGDLRKSGKQDGDSAGGGKGHSKKKK
jgi:hypothetical protein